MYLSCQGRCRARCWPSSAAHVVACRGHHGPLRIISPRRGCNHGPSRDSLLLLLLEFLLLRCCRGCSLAHSTACGCFFGDFRVRHASETEGGPMARLREPEVQAPPAIPLAPPELQLSVEACSRATRMRARRQRATCNKEPSPLSELLLKRSEGARSRSLAWIAPGLLRSLPRTSKPARCCSAADPPSPASYGYLIHSRRACLLLPTSHSIEPKTIGFCRDILAGPQQAANGKQSPHAALTDALTARSIAALLQLPPSKCGRHSPPPLAIQGQRTESGIRRGRLQRRDTAEGRELEGARGPRLIRPVPGHALVFRSTFSRARHKAW